MLKQSDLPLFLSTCRLEEQQGLGVMTTSREQWPPQRHNGIKFSDGPILHAFAFISCTELHIFNYCEQLAMNNTNWQLAVRATVHCLHI